IPLGTLERDELDFLTSFTNLPEVLAYLESTLNPFALPLRQIVDENVAPTNLNAIDGVFNRFYQSLLTKGIAKIPDGEIRSIMREMVREEREFQNITSILNLMGKLARGTLPSTVDLKGVIFSGKSHIQPEEVEDLIRNKDLGGLREILARSSFRERLATSAVDMVATTGIQSLVEEIEHLFYLNQIRKRYRRHVFNLALGYFWQMSVEARNLRIITHGIESFSREEIRRRIINA
ncbi:MAG: V0D/AC39 family V-type ATPase subunit, partial [Candidatus Heimdallarchaeota archaeon]